MNSQMKSAVRGVIMANLQQAGHAAGPGKKNAIPAVSSRYDTDHNAASSRPSNPPALIFSGQQDDDHNRPASRKSNPVTQPYVAKGKG